MTPSQRITAAFSPDNVRLLGGKLIDLLSDHFQAVESSSKSVLNWNEPPENIARAGAILDEAPVTDLASRFESLIEEMLARGHNLHDPRYIGHQVPAPVPIAGLFDALGSMTNQVMAIYEMGPWATSVERSLIERLGTRVGWKPGEFAGLVTHRTSDREERRAG
jgi:L-2,4-diaminobutyrate decarboxylase